ncbi:type II toxin-antitoxin system RelE/ParE family toxin [Novosphingobium sp. Chol11]|uniref:type II toxin-antitoxin system RelE/ParE family toxin n=1 Tax=Novosphingobium sp. Chol11 TaxID=1385763 RepID=UPI0025EE9C0A|nr:type II toxin-antitoxin system RelE/ParE family toxin [Novosphingobium sp. Chol11]
MTWLVAFHTAFEAEFANLPLGVRESLAAAATLLASQGPMLGRPHADTLAGSKHANMKELRFRANDGVWRAAFAFDPERKAILLVAGDKAGVAQSRFYKVLIAKADARFDAHLAVTKGN